jgi:hypothetical protein
LLFLTAAACGDTAPTASAVVGDVAQSASTNGATSTDADSASQLIDEAMALVENEAGSEPLDVCDLPNSWQYEALHYLSRAIDLDPDSALAVIDSKDVSGTLAGLGPAFDKWRLAIPEQWTSTRLETLMNDREWWPYRSSFPPEWVETRSDGEVVSVDFLEEVTAIGTWKIEGDNIVMALEAGDSVMLRPNSVRYAFDEGRSWFFVATLESVDPEAPIPWSNPLVVGPRAGECGDYNF